MMDIDEKVKGYVYILEVKDIDLPVCKIGMTTHNPYKRCAEINSSSTGDFIWEVAHQVTVDDCKKLESLVHSKLAPLRQKNREFFNIHAEDAYKAVISIIEAQSEIQKIKPEEIMSTMEVVPKKNKKKAEHMSGLKRTGPAYKELLKSFESVLNVEGMHFNQPTWPTFGWSDGNEGVQWNVSISADTGNIEFGVNLEGLKYESSNWPIATFILSELKSPNIEEIRSILKKPEDVYIRFSRDAWQVRSRRNIVEKYLGGKEVSIAEIDSEHWSRILKEALKCLNSEKNYRGRAKQTVTFENKPETGEQVRIMEVTPHLTIWSSMTLDGDITENMQNKLAELQPIYDWVARVSQS